MYYKVLLICCLPNVNEDYTFTFNFFLQIFAKICSLPSARTVERNLRRDPEEGTVPILRHGLPRVRQRRRVQGRLRSALLHRPRPPGGSVSVLRKEHGTLR